MVRVANSKRIDINPNITPEFLRRLISALPKGSSQEQIDTMEAALVRGYQLHFIYNQPEERRQTRTELKSSLSQLRGHLAKSSKILEGMNRRHGELLDEAYYYANDDDRSLIEMYAEGSSGFSVMVHRLEAAVEYFQRDFLIPPRPRADNLVYVRPIRHIAGVYRSAFPGMSVAGGKRTPFLRVISLWIELIAAKDMKCPGDMEEMTPASHIRTAMKKLGPE